MSIFTDSKNPFTGVIGQTFRKYSLKNVSIPRDAIQRKYYISAIAVAKAKLMCSSDSSLNDIINQAENFMPSEAGSLLSHSVCEENTAIKSGSPYSYRDLADDDLVYLSLSELEKLLIMYRDLLILIKL